MGKAAEQEARERGAFDYLQKPVDYAGLKAVINRAWGLTKRVSLAVADDLRLSFLGDLPEKGQGAWLPNPSQHPTRARGSGLKGPPRRR